MAKLPPVPVWLAGAALVALAAPVLLVTGVEPAGAPAPAPAGGTVLPAPVPAHGPGRRLFLDPLAPARVPVEDDAPRLVGIVGRLPDQAVAMIRAADGRTRTLSPGQSHGGWTLESLSPDAALFRRGERRVRSFLPAPEEDEEG